MATEKVFHIFSDNLSHKFHFGYSIDPANLQNLLTNIFNLNSEIIGLKDSSSSNNIIKLSIIAV